MIIRSTSHRLQSPPDGDWKPVPRVLPSPARFAALCFCLVAAVCTARGEAMLQLFQVKWADLTKKMPEIAEAGYTSLYLPQPAKAGSVFSVGYDLFDPFDLGDKDQRFTVATKYGTKAELLEAVATAHRFGIRVYFDNIMNHRGFDVPGYNAFTPTNIYPGLIPADFHLQTIPGGFNRNWPTIEDYGDQWKVQNEPLSGLLDLANEPGTLNFNFGNTLGSTTTKPTFIRQPNSPEYYADPALPDLGGGWRPFNATNGVPVPELVEAHLMRAAMWTLYETKCDGFRLDAVKHTPANFFGNGGNAFAGYTGGIQAMYDWVHGYGTNFNSDYAEADDCRNSCFDSEAPRNDALLFGEHLGFPPGYGDYISAGMRLLNTSMRGAVDHWAGGGAGWGLDQRDIGDFGANQGVQFAQNHDHMFCCVNARHLHNAYNFMHEGIPIIYSDGNNFAGDPYQSTTFPVVPFANYLGQYGDNQMPDVAWLHHQLARGGTRSRWSDANIVAWERYDYREVSGGDAFTNAHATVVLFAANNKTSFPGDINFDDGINQSPDGYYHCGVNDNPSRGVAMRVGFPPGSILSQLASSTPGNDRACRKLLVHRATTDAGAAAATANAPDPVDRLLLVNAAPPPGGGAIEMKIPSGGWVMYGYQWPEASRANIHPTAITLQQAGLKAPTITVYRKDGTNGDTGFNPLYPFKMRGSVDAAGNIVGGINVSNHTYAVDIPVLTNGNFDILVRSDASAINTLIKLDGGMDLNSHLGLGVTSGLDRRDNRPGSATDVFLGYEQSLFLFRNGPEKFAARNVARNIVVSHGAETYWYTVGDTNYVVNGPTNGPNTTTATASWVYHDPAAPNTAAGNPTPTQLVPQNPVAGQPADIWVKVGYNFQTNAGHLYYTTDATHPEGAYGVGKGTTKTVPLTWIAADVADPTIEWFKATIPGNDNAPGTQVRYKVGLFIGNIDTIADSDDSKLYGLSQFGIINFNPATATVWLHNNRNTNHTVTGLQSGFHIIRARSFLPRDGKSSVFNTFHQTFYYDAGLPAGVIAFPSADGQTITAENYTFVIRTDNSVTDVRFNIQDSSVNNDDVVTGSPNGNGNSNGAPIFASATQVTPDSGLNSQHPNLPREFRFTYASVASSNTATITVHLRTPSSDAHTNRYTTLTRTVNTTSPANTLHVTTPAVDGTILLLASNATYQTQTCFTSSLTNDPAHYSVFVNGVFQPRENYVFSPGRCGVGLRALLYTYVPLPGTNTVTVTYSNQVVLSDTRVFVVGWPGDTDGDGMSDHHELLAGTDVNDPDSVLQITGLANGSEIVWDSVPGRVYQVHGATNLGQPMVPISPFIQASGESSFYFDSLLDAVSKFYRVELIP